MEEEKSQIARNKIFISHATPHDNDFTRWLTLKLIALGYDVWCDILFLDKGVDFWKTIENEIRSHTCRFLVALSETSNNSEGVLQEIAVAKKVRKELQEETFIIPLLIDEKLSYDKINIELNRLNAINFTKSWIMGLGELLQSFDGYNIPKKTVDVGVSNELYNKIFLKNRKLIKKDEIFSSNWFSIQSFPPFLYFHAIGSDASGLFKKSFNFPIIQYKNCICTFSENIDYKYSSSDFFDGSNILKLSIEDIIDKNYGSDFITNVDSKRFIVRLANEGFRNLMRYKNLKPYNLANNRVGFWFEKDQLEKNKINGELYVGDIKGNNWHFGVSGFAKLKPHSIIVLSSHIFFTSDGKNLIVSRLRQLQLRRKQGRNWWNNKWNEKLRNIVKYLASDDGTIRIPVGSKENILVSSNSMHFTGHYSYISPKDNLQNSDLIDFDEVDDEEIEDNNIDWEDNEN